MNATARGAVVVYPVPETDPRWVLEDGVTMPETALHDAIVDELKAVLRAWLARTGRDGLVVGNVALRWDPQRVKVGVDPDVMWLEPTPPGGERALTSVRTWTPGHHPPRVAVEVVSQGTAGKDYDDGPEKYAASGTRELWVFDPEGHGPQTHGGPHRVQVWRLDDLGRFTRVYAGDGPVWSNAVGGWLVVTDHGLRLRLADDAAGAHPWPTQAEQERREKEQERREKEQERREKEAALAELARVRADLAGRPSG